MKCVEYELVGDIRNDGQWKCVVGALFSVRAQRLSDERQLELDADAQARISSDIDQQLQATTFIIAAFTNKQPNRDQSRTVDFPEERTLHFKQAFRVSPATLRFLVESCRCLLERESTSIREATSLEKRVAVCLYRLYSCAEDRTIAHLFGIGRSSVNMLYKDFCNAVIQKLEDDWLRMVRSDEMTTHMREFLAVFGFPHAVGALDGCHFPASPPKEHATDYHNYRGDIVEATGTVAFTVHMLRFASVVTKVEETVVVT
ncbi:hypothetical protein HPB47_011166 [Ixodes persulcatus]|uniref:Uncharacterized protein n=1 Tax=Ixodes persulcatus TaxID=34615 RepID=A0AC60NXA0_IXOPE|nr:hypothetical protein HPB47_011166 [Ixodes persulcatus]